MGKGFAYQKSEKEVCPTVRSEKKENTSCQGKGGVKKIVFSIKTRGDYNAIKKGQWKEKGAKKGVTESEKTRGG